MKPRFLHESNRYTELETGAVTVAFAAEEMAEINWLAIRPLRPADSAQPFEIAYICGDPQAAWDRVVAAGATALSPPQTKPWSQIVGYVRDLNGCLVELCSDMNTPA